MVPATGLRGSYFLPTTTGVRKVASQMIVCAATGTKHKTTTLLCGDHRSSEYTTLCYDSYICRSLTAKRTNFILCIRLAVYTLWPWWGVACLDCHRMEFILVKIILTVQAVIIYAAKHVIQPRFNALNFHKVIVFHTTSPPRTICIISIIRYDMIYGDAKITNKINSGVCLYM